ncbi:MAG TPA: hypothetical protein VF177_05435 [Anaerolineae bacterium]
MSGPTNNSPPERLQVMQQTASALNELLEKLYPESPSPDVITLEDFLKRYRLTELGAPAVQAIEQTQRINRTLNNYRQMGLSEFHIGLFYLHYGECQGSIKQFALARQQWSFIDEIASVCLAYFAEGQAHHLFYEYEVAMNRYLRAEQWLPRLSFSVPTQNQDEFVQVLRERLSKAQDVLRKEMIEYFKAGQAAREAQATAAEEQRRQERELEAETAAQELEETAAATPEDIPAAPQPVVPLPQFNIDSVPDWARTPIPAHTNSDENYVWYQVEETDEVFIPEVVEGAWVLVDRETTDHEFKPDELIVVVPSNDINGSIVLKPWTPVQPFQRIFLGTSRITGKFTRPMETGKVALAPDMEQRVNLADILGVVVGLWLPMQKLAAPVQSD